MDRPYNRGGRGQPMPSAAESYDGWDLVHRGAMAPWGVYEKDGQSASGFAWPAMVTEPVEAGGRFLGSMWSNPTPESERDLLTLLTSLYGGNAMNGLARGATRNALARDASSIGMKDYMTSIGKSLAHPGEPTRISPMLTDAYARSYGFDSQARLKQNSNAAMQSYLRDPRPANDMGTGGELSSYDLGSFNNALAKTRPELNAIDGGLSSRGRSEPFFQNGFIPDDGGSVTASQAYDHYVSWAARNNIDPVDVTTFSRAMSDAGYNKQRLAGSIRYTGVDLNDLLSDTGRPSLPGSALSSLSDAAEDAYVKAYRADLDANKYRYFNDWAEDPDAPLVVDNWGRQIGGGDEISELFSNATPYGYRALKETHPAVAEGLNAAAAAVGRDLNLMPSANSGSLYGTLNTPSGAQYKVRVADHGNISSKFDAPDYNIAPGAMTPEEFARLIPMLLSDNRPSLLGSALANALLPSSGGETH